MNLVRHELGFSGQGKRFPLKGTCLAIYSAAVNTQGDLADVLQSTFPWCAEWESDLRRLFLAYVEAKQAQQVLDYDDLLLYWAQMVSEPQLAHEIGARPLPKCMRRRAFGSKISDAVTRFPSLRRGVK